MKKILFVINSLTIGGSEKSLISLLNTLDYTKYEVDLQMLKKGKEFDKYIPKEVKILDVPKYYKYIEGEYTRNKFKYFCTRVKTKVFLLKNKYSKKKINAEQILFHNQKNSLEKNMKKYDVAIGYAQGFPTYYIVEKVEAKKKISWINCDYARTMYDKDLDYKYYKTIDKMVVVSNSIKESVRNIKEDYKEKLEVILDIVNPELIEKMSIENTKKIYDKKFINILTVGRIAYAKGHEKIIETSVLLKTNGYKFKWHIVGDGPNRKMIEDLIEKNNLQEEIILWGSQENPYIYMKDCDLYVQPSIKEGFGLTVVEAKILKKFIICTNFTTAKELIKNEVDGLIVNLDPIDIYEGIKRFLEDDILGNNIRKNLSLQKQYNSMDEIKKIEKILEE